MKPAISLILALLLTPVFQQEKPPEEVRIQGRWTNGALETRIREGPWVKTTAEIIQQLRSTGAGPETSVLLDIEADADWKSVVDLMEAVQKAKFAKIEFASPLKLGPGPRKAAPPLRIEITHATTDCPVRQACTSGPHWDLKVDQTSCLGSVALLKALRFEATKHSGPDAVRVWDHRVTVAVDGSAPSGLVTELKVACRRVGFRNIEMEADLAAPKAGMADPRGALLRAKDNENSPVSVVLGLRLRDGAIERKVDRGSWVATEAEWIEQLRDRKASAKTCLMIDPAPDVPWSAVQRMKRLLEQWGFRDASEFAPGFALDGALSTDGVDPVAAVEFSRKIEQECRKGDLSFFEQALCLDELLRRAFGGTKLSVPMRSMFAFMAEQYVPSIETPRGTGESSALHFLFNRTVDGSPRPVFRLLLPNRMDYLELVLAKGGAGALRIVDLFSRNSGELVTETLRANYLANPAILEVLNVLLAPTSEDLAGCMGKPGEMLVFLFDKKPAAALEFFEKNAAQFKTSKIAHRLRINIAGTVGIDEYRKALEEFDRDFPTDPSQPFLRMQRFLAAKDREQGLEAISALEKVVPGDAFLQVLRSQVHLNAGDFAQARACGEKATADEPHLDQGWWMTITACLGQKDFKATGEYLTATEKVLGIQLGDLSQNPAYAEFVKSAEYKDWIKSRR